MAKYEIKTHFEGYINDIKFDNKNHLQDDLDLKPNL